MGQIFLQNSSMYTKCLSRTKCQTVDSIAICLGSDQTLDLITIAKMLNI